MNLLLLTKTAIIKQIFNLVSHKLDIKITISTDTKYNSVDYDLVVVDDELYNEELSKGDTNRFIIISKDVDYYKPKADLVIQKPFLPSSLLTILTKQINQITTNIDSIKDNTTISIDDDEESQQSIDYIQTLADDISNEITNETDESIVPSSFVTNGGILDTNELSNIQNILDDTSSIQPQPNTTNQNQDDNEDDWHDLSQIIDQAIDEVNSYHYESKKPIKLILNKYSINELSPLLNKLDQNIIDALTNGEEIELQLKMEL
jgi:hypothetical protein